MHEIAKEIALGRDARLSRRRMPPAQREGEMRLPVGVTTVTNEVTTGVPAPALRHRRLPSAQRGGGGARLPRMQGPAQRLG